MRALSSSAAIYLNTSFPHLRGRVGGEGREVLERSQGRRLSSLVLLSFLAWVLIVVAGCGSSDPRKYRVSGTVTYDGKPVPQGTVFFVPDAAKDNHGPGAQAVIKDGAYQTERRAVVGGPYVITVAGRDAAGKPLFTGHSEKVDLPKGSATQDIKIPAEAPPQPLTPAPKPGTKSGGGPRVPSPGRVPPRMSR
ncbi:MAG: hypothetical protein ACLQNE_46440 [Thermoguttaceae bacterium]